MNKEFDVSNETLITLLREKRVIGYFDEEVLDNLINEYQDIDYKPSEELKNRIFWAFKQANKDWLDILKETDKNNNFGIFIEMMLDYLEVDPSEFDIELRDIYKKILEIKSGKIAPWDIHPLQLLTFADTVDIDVHIMINSIKKHPANSTDDSMNSSYGMCARAEKGMSAKQRVDVMQDALSKLLNADEEGKKQKFIQDLNRLSQKIQD